MEALQKRLLNQPDVTEQKVEVNQRHLIDKILARYSAEFTIYRELIQNANDAGARHVKIELSGPERTQSDDTNTIPTHFNELTVKNDGRIFQDEDWNRLRKIAEGNPDADKIGYFGVGFFSTFSLCEEPFVQSGDNCMAFYWKGDQLFIKKGKTSQDSIVSNEQGNPWTTFYMKLRKSEELPNVEEFTKFLVFSLLFTSTLESIIATCDGVVIADISRKMSSYCPIDSFKQLRFNRTSPRGIFTMNEVKSCNFQVDIKKLSSPKKTITETILGAFNFAPSKPREISYEKTHVFLKSVCGESSVRLPKDLIKDMVRTTKKEPPSKTKVQMIFAGYDELCASNLPPEIDDVVPRNGQGKIFIGFSTHQSTGIPSHISAHFIPTVERENIDFVDRVLSVWNQELLYQCGLLSRVIFENEMQKLSKSNGSDSKNSAERVVQYGDYELDKAIHLLQSVTYQNSTPSIFVSNNIQKAFYRCLNSQIQLLSSRGILSADKIRVPNDKILLFAHSIPVIPKKVMRECSELIQKLISASIIAEISIDDVFDDLSFRVLTYDEAVHVFSWWIDLLKSRGSLSKKDFSRFLNLVRINHNEKIIVLKDLHYYANVRTIPPDLPLPSNTMPFEVSRKIQMPESSKFLNLKELILSDWLNFVVETDDFGVSQKFTERVLETISRAYSRINAEQKSTVISLLERTKCIPVKTRHETEISFKLPSDSYFDDVKLFDDLFITSLSSNNIPRKFLEDIGVRTHVELQLIFDRLADLEWDIFQLIKYLASVKGRLSELELTRLSKTPFLQEEKNEKGAKIRYAAHDLFAPTETMKKLGLPIIKWPAGKWRLQGPEAQFLISLGLKVFIPLSLIIEKASSKNSDKNGRKIALRYFVDNYNSLYSTVYEASKVSTPFLPCSDTEELQIPSNCFSDSRCSCMGFHVLSKEWSDHAEVFGVISGPSTRVLIAKLSSLKLSQAEANTVFTYLSTRIQDFSKSDFERLNNINFIPIEKNENTKTKYLAPNAVYFKGNDSSSMYEGIFYFVDFGLGNGFLKYCGVKDEPNVLELSNYLIESAPTLLASYGVSRYLDILRRLALNVDQLRKHKTYFEKLKAAPILIGFVESQDSSQEASKAFLRRAAEISLIDDSMVQKIFNPISAPLETLLEEFYEVLGSKWLTKEVKEYWSPFGEPATSMKTETLKSLIRERAPLLVQDYHLKVKNKHESRSAETQKSVDKIFKLEVLKVEKIELRKVLRNSSHIQATTACCGHMGSSGPPALLVVANFDYFDVARVLSLFLFNRAKLNDSLLLSTLLSTSLENLKQKGFQVDRVLRNDPKFKEKDQKPILNTEIASQSTTSTDSSKETRVSASSQSQNSKDANIESLKQVFPSLSEKAIVSLLQKYKTPEEVCAHLLDQDRNDDTKGGELDDNSESTNLIPKKGPNWMNRLFHEASSRINQGIGAARSNSIFQGSGNKKEPSLIKSEATSSGSNEPIMDPSSLKSALEDSARYGGGIKPYLKTAETIQEYASKSMACETIPANNLELYGYVYSTVGGSSVRIPVLFDVQSEESAYELVMGANYESRQYPVCLRMFSRIISNLAAIFDVKRTSLHIFYTPKKETDTIAFNSGGSLFFNIAHFLRTGFTVSGEQLFGTELDGISDKEIPIKFIGRDAFIFWFMVFCHELAHNFVGPHDANHEFFMSSYSEHYMLKLWKLLEENGLGVI